MSNVEAFTPARDRLLVLPDRPDSGEKVLESGLILPDIGPDKKASSGVVVRVAEGSQFTEGQRVVYSPYSGYSMRIDDTTYLLLGEHEPLGCFERGGVLVEVR